ncbi:hypothetical protein B0I35DRAFT_409955 [Stachybotrys elegans]|uniref:Uncharacterized protein n=1 Tax=Stachybotrys elegans TaxID=80388 RepID=A0A8K0WPT5_9HYPO|nr:hypothetical protein B0I35DRAFT_409955 [Stachybotrys elegans]
MSYYDNPQWPTSGQNWEHQGATTPVRAGASGPQPQDDYAFSYQFDEVDRAYENLQKSGKGFMMGGRHNRVSHGGSRSHSINYDGPQGGQGQNLHNFYAAQRHQSSRGSNEAEQVMQAKRRMAAQRERELRNLHTEQQYQRTVLSEMAMPGNNKHMSEEETRELIARQRSALYGEGPFADKSSYVDENGNVRQGAPGPSSTSSLRGNSPLTFDGLGRAPPAATDAGTPSSVNDANGPPADPSPRPQGTASPQTAGPTNKVFDNAVGPQSRTSTSSPTGGSPPRDLAPGSKQGQSAVAPIGTRPSGTPTGASAAKRSTTPMGSSGGWGRGNGVWGQSSGLGAQASVWG